MNSDWDERESRLALENALNSVTVTYADLARMLKIKADFARETIAKVREAYTKAQPRLTEQESLIKRILGLKPERLEKAES